jgi:iron-sulfur cluster assembly accessory protein
MNQLLFRSLSTIKKAPITITIAANNKINNILKQTNKSSFLFSATSGGCNGFNYKLEPINDLELLKNATKIDNVYIDPYSEMFLLGTNIDYLEQDYTKNIFESKFIFIPDKKLATSCWCGISFSPKKIE